MEDLQQSLSAQMIRAHAALLQDLCRLEEASRRNTSSNSATVLQLLQRMQTDLHEHFRCEEQDGYMDAVRKREPNKEKVIEELHVEHRDIADKLEHLIRQIEAGSLTERARTDAVVQWVKTVRRHESKENALVQHAFNDDLSAED